MAHKFRIRFLTTGIIFMFIITMSSCKSKTDINNAVAEENIKNSVLYYNEGRFAAWPANNGIWIWDNEILVGFVEAAHKDKIGHTYDRITARDKYARSKDGGNNWNIEDAFQSGQAGRRDDNELPDDFQKEPSPLTEKIDFNNPDLALTFLRETNDTGPSFFYYSYNRGSFWKGPFRLPNLGTPGIATRTDYIIDGKHELTAFFTVSKENGKEGRILCARTCDGGLTWEKVSWVGSEPEGFDIMSSTVRLSPTKMLTVIRTRKGNGQDLLTSYVTKDNGKTWEQLKDPVADTGRGGSPPALLKLNDGRLALGYIYRSAYGSRVNVRFSSDDGENWSDEIILRGGDGATTDTGYPRMVQRPDGKLIMIYYWNNAKLEGAKPFRYIASTIFDPDLWK